VVESVDDRDARIYFDGATVEDGGAIAPLADRGKRRLDEEGIAGDYFERFDRASGGDEGVKFHAAFAMDLDGEGRISGLDASDELSHLYHFTDFPPLVSFGSFLLGRNHRTRCGRSIPSSDTRRLGKSGDRIANGAVGL